MTVLIVCAVADRYTVLSVRGRNKVKVPPPPEHAVFGLLPILDTAADKQSTVEVIARVSTSFGNAAAWCPSQVKSAISSIGWKASVELHVQSAEVVAAPVPVSKNALAPTTDVAA